MPTSLARGSKKGLFDVHYEGDLRHWTGSYDVPALDEGWILRGSRWIGQVTTQTAIVLNMEYAPLEDVRVREALALAMDFEWQNRVRVCFFDRGSHLRFGNDNRFRLALN